jgi:hypothetical protein
VALENFPVPNTGLAFPSKPVVSADAQLFHNPEAEDDCGNIAQENVGQKMVPPTLSKMMKSVLSGQLNNFVKNVPEVKDVGVTNHNCSEDPINPMNQVVVVHVVPQILESELAVVVVGVHSSSNRYSGTAVQEIERLTTELGSLVEHEDQPAEVEKHNAHNHSIDALHPDVLHSFDVGLKVCK